MHNTKQFTTISYFNTNEYYNILYYIIITFLSIKINYKVIV